MYRMHDTGESETERVLAQGFIHEHDSNASLMTDDDDAFTQNCSARPRACVSFSVGGIMISEQVPRMA